MEYPFLAKMFLKALSRSWFYSKDTAVLSDVYVEHSVSYKRRVPLENFLISGSSRIYIYLPVLPPEDVRLIGHNHHCMRTG